MELQEILRQQKVTQRKADGVLTRFDATNTCLHLVVYLQALRFTVIYRSVQICADVPLCSVVQHGFFLTFHDCGDMPVPRWQTRWPTSSHNGKLDQKKPRHF